MTVAVGVINYNGAPFLIQCLEGLLAQTCQHLEIVIIDNYSTDDSIQLLDEHFSQIRLIKNDKNIGYAGAANVAIRKTQSDYLCLMNPDVFLTPNFIETLVNFAEVNPGVGSLTGKLLRFPRERIPPIIDSTGHTLFRNRWVINRGEGEEDQGQYEYPEEVFGVCGAAAFYRRTMLEDIKSEKEYLDESFFLYLEDVDLDWRARLKGWKAYYVPSAIGYHQRGYLNIFESKNLLILRHCLKNRYLMMIKNENLRDLLLDAWTIVPYEIMRFSKFLVISPRSLMGYWDVIKLSPSLIKKRFEIQKNIIVNRRERRSWIDNSGLYRQMRNRLHLFLN